MHQDALSSLCGAYDSVPLWLVERFPPPLAPLAFPFPFWDAPSDVNMFQRYLTRECSLLFQCFYDNCSASHIHWARCVFLLFELKVCIFNNYYRKSSARSIVHYTQVLDSGGHRVPPLRQPARLRPPQRAVGWRRVHQPAQVLTWCPTGDNLLANMSTVQCAIASFNVSKLNFDSMYSTKTEQHNVYFWTIPFNIAKHT